VAMIAPCVQLSRYRCRPIDPARPPPHIHRPAGSTFRACGGAGETNPSPDDVLDVLVYSWRLGRVKLNLDDADRKLNHINQLCDARSDFSLIDRRVVQPSMRLPPRDPKG
jgi:hypothetical protein